MPINSMIHSPPLQFGTIYRKETPFRKDDKQFIADKEALPSTESPDIFEFQLQGDTKHYYASTKEDAATLNKPNYQTLSARVNYLEKMGVEDFSLPPLPPKSPQVDTRINRRVLETKKSILASPAGGVVSKTKDNFTPGEIAFIAQLAGTPEDSLWQGTRLDPASGKIIHYVATKQAAESAKSDQTSGKFNKLWNDICLNPVM